VASRSRATWGWCRWKIRAERSAGWFTSRNKAAHCCACAGGGGAGDGARRPSMAQQYVHLAMRRGRKIAKDAMARRLAIQMYWMMGKRADEKVRFARGTARISPWCAVEHREIDWASRSSTRGVRSSNHDRSSRPKRCMGRTEFLTSVDYKRALVGMAVLQLERNGALFRVHKFVRSKSA
jgi:hypothetical protein